EKLRKIGCRGTTARTDTNPLTSNFGDRSDPGFLQHEELKWRIIHWKDGSHRTSRRFAGPHASTIPCLERYSSCDEAELGLTRLEQFYVLYGPFSGQPHNRKIEGPGQNLRQPLAIDVVGAARRCRPDEELIWPVGLAGA